MKSFEKLLFFSLIIFCMTLLGCSAKKIVSCQSERKIQLSDILDIVNTLQSWGQANWFTYENFSLIYNMSQNDVQYYVARYFESPDHLKMLAWAGDKLPNGVSKHKAAGKLYKICPAAGDTICDMSAVIGFRKKVSDKWEIYPFLNKTVICAKDRASCEEVLEEYYFNKMRHHKMIKIDNTLAGRGQFISVEYGYNICDADFWSRCWLWEKDTVGSDNLYPFQIERYGWGTDTICIKCGIPYKRPVPGKQKAD